LDSDFYIQKDEQEFEKRDIFKSVEINEKKSVKIISNVYLDFIENFEVRKYA
jgi:hypothetical protein